MFIQGLYAKGYMQRVISLCLYKGYMQKGYTQKGYMQKGYTQRVYVAKGFME
jgi:hypothetical protein